MSVPSNSSTFRTARRAWHTLGARSTVSGGVHTAALAWLLTAGCGTDRTHFNDAPSGSGGQVAGGGSSAVGGAGGTSAGGTGPSTGGSSGIAGAGGSDSAPSLCLGGDEPFAWPERRAELVPPSSTWKADIEVPNDPFFSSPLGGLNNPVSWVKFIILPTDPDQIYFQDSAQFPFHFDFARDHLPPFQRMTRGDFDAVSLHNEGRQAILGTVLTPGSAASEAAYAVQLASSDDLHPELVDQVMRTVAAHVTAPPGTRAYYFPSNASASCINAKRTDFAERGIELGGVGDWLVGDGCYAPGWAAGRLVQASAAEVDAAYLDGSLTPDDILLLSDGPPAELPYVAGIVTLEPATPNSHVAILARSYGVPFVYVREAAEAQSLVGKKVVVSSNLNPLADALTECDVRFLDIDSLSAESFGQIVALAAPPAVRLAPKRSAGALWLTAEGLIPDDIDRVGGKAAHFGLLRAAAPERTPAPAVALSFDLWDVFMSAPAPSGGAGTLRDEIASRLAPHPWPVDMLELDAVLDDIRDLIEDAPFPPNLRASVQDALVGFDPMRRIRFRSSTNVEDSDTFTGAGLYDSATGCLADDLDADELGPSLCNPGELEERGVFRAIQRVYASFYFRNAYFERLRRGVNEAEVAMGVLVHYSVPDPEELANGVATLSVGASPNHRAELVSQAGAASVTNPDGSAIAEQVRFAQFEGFDIVSTLQNSSLVPFGDHVMRWEDDYRELMSLFIRVSERYTLATSKAPPFILDFEYKKVAPGELSLRQVRPLPLPNAEVNVTPFFVGTPETLCLYSDESTDVFAMHRLKARIQIAGGEMSLSAEQLASRLYSSARVEYVDAAAAAVLDGDPATFPGAAHAIEPIPTDAFGEVTVLDRWRSSGALWTLRTHFRSKVARTENPVYTPDTFRFELGATWDQPVPYLEPDDSSSFDPATRSEELIQLWGTCPEDVTETAELRHIAQTFAAPNDVRIDTAYWHPPMPQGDVIAIYTAPLMKWERTTISGLTTEPIVLAGYFAQTYRPYHHNFGGQYIFDPRLEPGLSAATLAELEAADIAFIAVMDNADVDDEVWVAGIDGALRRL